MTSGNLTAASVALSPLIVGNNCEVPECGQVFGKEASQTLSVPFQKYWAYVEDRNSTGALRRERAIPTEVMPRHFMQVLARKLAGGG